MKTYPFLHCTIKGSTFTAVLCSNFECYDMYNVKFYVGGFHRSLPTFCKQASIQLEDFPRALADAAAALFMDPTCSKAWERYCLCLIRY